VTLWLVRPAPDRRGLFEIIPHERDPNALDWYMTPGRRLLAASWLGAAALIPAGLVRLAVGEDGAWWGPAAMRARTRSEAA
jgi:hypothetical protein